jgi:hypothetical protein
LGEFSPIGWLLTLGTKFSKKVQNWQLLGLLFPTYQLCIYFDKNGLGYILGDFLGYILGDFLGDFGRLFHKLTLPPFPELTNLYERRRNDSAFFK